VFCSVNFTSCNRDSHFILQKMPALDNWSDTPRELIQQIYGNCYLMMTNIHDFFKDFFQLLL
jgi:hypothetical protein